MSEAQKGHDYLPEHDHEVIDAPGGDLGAALARAEAAARAELLPALGLPGMDVFHVAHGGFGDVIALYCDGTSSWPVVGLDASAIEDGCLDHGLDLETQLRASIAHELGHAYQEALGLGYEDREEPAEEFARVWAMEGRVDVSLLSGASPSPAGP